MTEAEWLACGDAEMLWGHCRRPVMDRQAMLLRVAFCRHALTVGNQPEQYDVNNWATCILLDRGHRIRLEVASSAFPKFDRNLNTGGRIGYEKTGIVADQTVYHDRTRLSYLTLPVVPRASR